MEAQTTKTERILEAAMQEHAADPERAGALLRARTFKRSWIELAATLVRIREQTSWQRWGFESFEDYFHKELHLRRSTVDKLCASYGFLRANAPRLVRDRDGDPDDRLAHDSGDLDDPRHARPSPGHGYDDGPVPSWEAVQYVAKAHERGAAGAETMAEMKRAAFEEGATVPALAKRFREVAFPVDDEEKKERLRGQILATARRLADLVAEPDAQVPRKLAEQAELLAGELTRVLGGE